MSRRSTIKDAKRNARLAWIAQEIGKGQTDAQLVISCMAAFPGVSEKQVRSELKEIYQRFSEINADNLPDQKAKFLELGFTLLQEMRQSMQLGPAANHFKTLANIAGVVTDNSKVSVNDTSSTQGTPKTDVVRSRIEALRTDPKVRERAKKLGLDIDED